MAEERSERAMLSDIAADVAAIRKHTTFLAYLVWALIGLWVVTVLLNVVA